MLRVGLFALALAGCAEVQTETTTATSSQPLTITGTPVIGVSEVHGPVDLVPDRVPRPRAVPLRGPSGAPRPAAGGCASESVLTGGSGYCVNG